jgi:beta-glucosidase
MFCGINPLLVSDAWTIALRPADTGRLVRVLVGFRSVRLDAGCTERIVVDCSTRPLQRWTGNGFVLDADDVRIEAASHAGDSDAVTATLPVVVR